MTTPQINPNKSIKLETTERPSKMPKEIPPFNFEEGFNEELLNFFKENQGLLQELIEDDDEGHEGCFQPMPSTPYHTVFPLQETFAAEAISPCIETLELFEQMVASIEHQHALGDTKTVIFLDKQELGDSLFSGAQILIEEFSTAPKAFNVTLIANEAACSLIKTQLALLIAQIKQKDLPFSIHRLEINLLKEEEPLYIREEPVNRDKEEDNQE